ncbi:uncharacterized protein EV420DRAFT_1642484 [Desarmillaria tabescens]|uniref:Uncharacterized protein n=1 Tax=Armillaria tabescens TaxID=1929756 RepID=A0AA39N5L1_ARMTA|nr:uncharacterized protein EV420DRAFT_1642484 [Desarmillaria tabescens]KAK0458762.1 hypothetical protein EV420DRAFT_1642484 [Desarmillaria tabescens]
MDWESGARLKMWFRASTPESACTRDSLATISCSPSDISSSVAPSRSTSSTSPGFADKAFDCDNSLLSSLCAVFINGLHDPTELSTIYTSRWVGLWLYFNLDTIPPPGASSIRCDRPESWPAGTKRMDRDDFIARLSDTGV